MNNKEKNTYVKEQVTTAFIRLLREKNINDISISELTERAQVGRVSFYRNYASKEDVLMQESQRLLHQWGDLFAQMESEEYNSFFLSLFDFFKKKHMLNPGMTEEGSIREGLKKQSTQFTFLNKVVLSEPSVLV